MHFQYMPMLLLLLVIPPLVLGAVMAAFARKQAFIASYGERKLTQKGARTMSRLVAWTRAVSAALGVAMLVVALARPSLESGRVEFPQGSTDVIVMVDVSRSMAALDYKGKMPQKTLFDHGTRLDMARHLIREDVVPALGANRLGIVTFAGEAFPLAPLTGDASAVDWMQIRAATISSAPGEGSALVKAFTTAFKLFDLDSKPDHRKVIILFSDGGNDDDLDGLNAITQELRNRGVELVVVGLGKTTPSPIPVKELSPADQYSREEFYTDKNGEVAMSQLDENVLRLLANRAGGRYVRVNQAGDFSFSSLAQRLDLQYRPGRQQLFMYPLMLSVLLLGFAWFLGDEVLSKFRKRDAS